MYRKCCVPLCNSLRKDVLFHRFPSKNENKSHWLKVIKCENSDLSKLYVCHKHFEQRFVNTTTNRLKSGAYPNLFTDLEICSGKPTSLDIDIPKNLTSDHSYSRKCHNDHNYVLPFHHATNKVICSEIVEDIQHSTSSGSTDCAMSQNVPMNPSSDLLETPKKPVKRRVVINVKSLTPQCTLLYKEYKKVKRQNNYFQRSRRAFLFNKEKSFKELTKNINSLAKKILWMQIKLCTKRKSARRFTLEEKLIALSIYKQGPKCYRFLQKVFILPTKKTLQNLISQLDISPGINTKNL